MQLTLLLSYRVSGWQIVTKYYYCIDSEIITKWITISQFLHDIVYHFTFGLARARDS